MNQVNILDGFKMTFHAPVWDSLFIISIVAVIMAIAAIVYVSHEINRGD